MIKTESEIFVVNERYDIVDESGYVVESYAEEQKTIPRWEEVIELEETAWCDAYLSAKNYIKENGGNLIINRVLEIKTTKVQLVT
jgi:hypothetical protein